MRSHQQIVQEYGASRLGRALVDVGVDLKPTSPQRWADRNSIPSEYWVPMVSLGVATLDELAHAAADASPNIPDSFGCAA